MKGNAVIYARYSSEKQTEQSIEGQIHICQKYAEDNNLTIIETYIDRAKSGRNDNREAFQKMLKDTFSNNFSVVIVYSLDRFARNREDSAKNKVILKKNNVRLISATQQINQTPDGIILESVLEGLAEYYSVELAQKLERGRKESIAKGQYVGGFVPYGYKIIDKKFVINPFEESNIKLIFNLFLKYHNYKDIVFYLETNNILNRRQSNFKIHQITNILKNKVYIGILKSGKFIKENAVPIIIEKNIFEESQIIMQTHYIARSKSPARFALSGKIICGECNSNYVGDSATGKLGKAYYYYTCFNKKNNKGCTMDRLSKEKFEDFIYIKAMSEINSPLYTNMITSLIKKRLESDEDFKRIDIIKRDLISIDKKLENISNAIQNGIINEKIKIQNATLIEKQEALNLELVEIKNNPLLNLTIDKIKDYVENRYLKSDKETLLHILIYRIYIYKDRMVILLNLTDPSCPTSRKQIISNINPNSLPTKT